MYSDYELIKAKVASKFQYAEFFPGKCALNVEKPQKHLTVLQRSSRSGRCIFLSNSSLNPQSASCLITWSWPSYGREYFTVRLPADCVPPTRKLTLIMPCNKVTGCQISQSSSRHWLRSLQTSSSRFLTPALPEWLLANRRP